MKQNLSYTSMLKYDTNAAYILCKKKLGYQNLTKVNDTSTDDTQ